MNSESLRFKINLAIAGTGIIVSLVFSVLFYMYDMKQKTLHLSRIQFLLETVVELNKADIANEIFARQKLALASTAASIRSLNGITVITIFDAQGKQVYSTESASQRSLSPEEINTLQQAPTFLVDTDRNGYAIYSSVITIIQEPIGFIQLHFDLEDLKNESLITLLFFVVLLCITLLSMFIFLNYFLTRHVISPAHVLIKAIINVREGKFGQPVEIDTKGEIGDIAAAFNEISIKLHKQHVELMDLLQQKETYAARLDESHKVLEELNADLENMVAIRTSELRKTNEKLQQEIDERKAMNNTLRQSEERFRVIFQTIPDAVSISRSDDGKVVDINDRFAKLVGYRKEEVIGKPASEVGFLYDKKD